MQFTVMEERHVDEIVCNMYGLDAKAALV